MAAVASPSRECIKSGCIDPNPITPTAHQVRSHLFYFCSPFGRIVGSNNLRLGDNAVFFLGKRIPICKKQRKRKKNHWSSAQRHSLFLQTPLGTPGYTTGHNELHFCAALLSLTAVPTWTGRTAASSVFPGTLGYVVDFSL